MNIKSVRNLSERHIQLKKFHESCCSDIAELTVEGYTICTVKLDPDASRLIMVDVRRGLMEQMQSIEKEIQAETTEV